MNQLSDNLILKIIDHLPTYKDVMKLKQINKRFNRIVKEEFKFSNLIISHLKMPLNQRWFYSYELIKGHLLKTIDYSLVQIGSNQLTDDCLSNLKKLLIISTDYANFEKYNLTKLFDQINNQLIGIEHLELIGLKMEKSNFVQLKSPNLTTLNLERIEIGHITLKTPKLKYLKIDLFDSFEKKLQFDHPESVKLLLVNFFEKCITSFVNLEYLFIFEKLMLNDVQNAEKDDKQTKNVDKQTKDANKQTKKTIDQANLFLNKFPVLKELQFYLERQTYLYLVAQKQALKKDQLKIYFCGVDLVNYDFGFLPNTDWSPYFNISHDVIRFYNENFDRTAIALPFARRFIYDNLDGYIEKVPEELMNKFVGLNTIEVNGPISDTTLFVNFLKCFKNLKTLRFSNSNLNQRFFNLLPKLHSVLDKLILDKLEIYNEIDFEYNFILWFENLNQIHIDNNLNLDFVYKVFEKFGDLKFCFFYEDVEVVLNVDSNQFELCVEKKKTLKFKNIDKMFDHFAQIDFTEFKDCLSDTDMRDDYELDDFDVEPDEDEDFGMY